MLRLNVMHLRYIPTTFTMRIFNAEETIGFHILGAISYLYDVHDYAIRDKEKLALYSIMNLERFKLNASFDMLRILVLT